MPIGNAYWLTLVTCGWDRNQYKLGNTNDSIRSQNALNWERIKRGQEI